MRTFIRSGTAAVLLVLCLAATVRAQSTIAADTLAGSVGINVHLHYDGSLYRDNFDLVKSRLLELGVRHVRDGLVDTTWTGYYDRHKALAAAGITGVFITSADQSSALLQSYPARVAGAFEAYEAPNEYNWSGDPQWATTLRNALTRLRALKAIPELANIPVYGPAIADPSAYAALGDISALVDTGNLHNYFSGRNPGTLGWGAGGYGSIDWNLLGIRPYIGSKPVITTETGYWDDAALTAAIPDDMIATYVPRMVLEQLRKGITRTYIYELCDAPVSGMANTSGYGLLKRDGSLKPAFLSLKNLMALLADPGPAFTVQPLAYSVTGAGPSVRQMAFQRRDGSYYLALWIEDSGYDVVARVPVAVPPQSISVALPATLQAVSSRQWNSDGSVSTTSLARRSGPVPVTISDRLLILELRNLPPQPPANIRITRD